MQKIIRVGQCFMELFRK